MGSGKGIGRKTGRDGLLKDTGRMTAGIVQNKYIVNRIKICYIKGITKTFFDVIGGGAV